MTEMTAEMFGANTPIVPDETLEEWLRDEPVKKMTKRELIQKQIEELQTALKLLEIEENRRTPCEKAYRDAYGEFPITDSMSGGDKDYIAWDAFQKGWEASRVYHNKYFVIENTKQEEVKKLQEKEWTYKITDEHGETNPYKQYLNSVKNLQENNWYVDAKSLVKPQTLYSLIGEFLNEIDYMYNTDSEREYFLEKFEEWLPKEQSAVGSQNVYVECTVEGFNDCLQKIKSKLR